METNAAAATKNEEGIPADGSRERASPPSLASVRTSERALSGLVALACVAVLALAAWLTPSRDGHGTHTQLGLLPCAWVVAFDKPCPTCGMTTAFSLAAEGQYAAAALVQPAGAGLAVLSSAVFWIALHTALTGSRAAPMALKLVRPSTLWIAGAVLALAWGYKLLTWPTGG